MTRKQMLEELDRMFYLEPGTLTGAEKLKDISYWDSMAVLTFMSLLDERAGVAISPEAIVQCVTTGDLADLGAPGSAA